VGGPGLEARVAPATGAVMALMPGQPPHHPGPFAGDPGLRRVSALAWFSYVPVKC